MFSSRHILFSLAFILCLVLIGATTAVRGSGFAVIEQSASGIGAAFSGANAGAQEDASVIFCNPAAMTKLEGTHVVAGGHMIMPSFDFSNDGSSYPMLGMPLAGDNGGNGGENVFIPNLYGMQALSEKMTLGVGINTPIGLMTEYDEGWAGRYHAIKSDLATININPSLAWKLSDKLSIGAGVNAQYLDVELSSAIDFGGILAGAGTPGVTPQMLDGKGTVDGDDWGYGYNIGLLCTPRDGSQIGLNYRSSIEYTIEGDAQFSVPLPARPLQAMGMFIDTSAQADLEVPQTAGIGIAQNIGDKMQLMLDLTWTGWSCFEELRVDYDSLQPDAVTEENWNDTWRYAVGMNYFCNEQWTLRAGTAYDETPVPDAQHRTPRIPDGDRLWFSLGAGFKASEDFSVDAGYTYLIFNDTETDVIGATGDRLTGSYEGSVNIVSVQLNWNF